MTSARISHNDLHGSDTGGERRFGSRHSPTVSSGILLSNGLDGLSETRTFFARNLKFWLQERDLTAVELSRRLTERGIAMGKGAISHWMNERTEPDLETLVAVAEILGITVSDLLDSGEAVLNQMAKRMGRKVKIEPKKN